MTVAHNLYLTEFGLLQDQAEATWAEFRRKFGFPNDPPLPIEMLARQGFGLNSAARRLRSSGPREAGRLSVADKAIYVDERCSMAQRSFVLAHELAHWILHEKHGLSHFQDNLSLHAMLRSSCTATKKEQARLREVEANDLAAALLIPGSMLQASAEGYAIINDQVLVKLAGSF